MPYFTIIAAAYFILAPSISRIKRTNFDTRSLKNKLSNHFLQHQNITAIQADFAQTRINVLQTSYFFKSNFVTFINKMALRNDWDDLMGDVEWEDSEVDSGYFDSDNEAGNPGS